MFGEKLSTFFKDGEGGEAVTYETKTVLGIFSEDYIQVQGVQSTAITFVCAVEDLPNVTNKKFITRTAGGARFKIIESQADGTGLIKLILHET